MCRRCFVLLPRQTRRCLFVCNEYTWRKPLAFAHRRLQPANRTKTLVFMAWVLVMLFAAWAMYHRVGLTPNPEEGVVVLQPSRPLTREEIRAGTYDSVMDALWTAERSDCGATAVDVGAYLRIWTRNGLMMINPVVDSNVGGERVYLSETRRVCMAGTPSRTVNTWRTNRVELTYQTVRSAHNVTTLLSGVEAICAQYVDDLFAGRIRCATRESAAHRVQ